MKYCHIFNYITFYHLMQSTMLGFDPLGIVKSKEQLFLLREAEIKHARIAMLAAIGWPVSELCHYTIAKIFGKPLFTI